MDIKTSNVTKDKIVLCKYKAEIELQREIDSSLSYWNIFNTHLSGLDITSNKKIRERDFEQCDYKSSPNRHIEHNTK